MTFGQCKVEDKKSARQIFRKDFFEGCYMLQYMYNDVFQRIVKL